jgi:hypothetical protein
MEDLIPLIIVIAISIIGALTRKKKRPDDENISRPEQHLLRDQEIFKWFEKFEDEEILPVQHESPLHSAVNVASAEKKVAEKETVPSRFSQYGGFISPEERDEIMAKEGISVTKSKKSKEDEPQHDHETTENGIENPKNDFDLRRAVVFSEILNRKYV